MAETEVTQIWMAGVVSMMVTFGLIALYGYTKHRKRNH